MSSVDATDGPEQQRLGWRVAELTIGHVVARQAAALGDRPYLDFLPDGRRLSYAELDRASNRLAHALMRQGIQPGSHVAVMLENCPEQLLLYVALGKIGAVVVPLNTAGRGQLLHYYLTHSDAVALVTQASLLPHIEALRGTLPGLRQTVVLPGEVEGPAGGAGLIDYRSLLDGPDTPVQVPVRFSDLAFLLYTSGTTGPSKAIMFSHAYALLYGIDQAENYGFRADDTVHVCLPLFHANGLLSHCYGALVVGARVALVRRFSASNFWREVRDSGATVLSLLGSMANILWSLPPSEMDARHRVRQATIAPVPSARTAFEQRYGLRMLSTYGLTDYGIGAIYKLDEPPSKLGSAGRPRKGMQLRVVDDNDMPMPAGEVGEIVMRSDYPWNTASGYYKMPEATLASRRNGWFHTGDRGYLDADGYLYFADRKKDAIRRRGENISAFEVEQAIVSHGGVADVAVFPVSSALGEDEVAAAVVRRPGAGTTEADLIEHCQRNMAYFMVPRFIRFMDDLPRSPTHKVLKYALQEEAKAAPELYWDREKAGIVLRR
jgi:crotonobetaine/carnitine-CoA ligase